MNHEGDAVRGPTCVYDQIAREAVFAQEFCLLYGQGALLMVSVIAFSVCLDHFILVRLTVRLALPTSINRQKLVPSYHILRVKCRP